MQDIVDVVTRMWADLIARPGGPYAFRLVVQPLLALVLAVRDGVRDAKTGRSPYFWNVMHDPAERSARVREALRATAKVGCMAIALDVIYQLRVRGWVYPGEALGIALLLALVPYGAMRGPVDRLARRCIAGQPSRHAPANGARPPRTT
jgi:hypothetical protein